jgi:GGDEF domain-containing protein
VSTSISVGIARHRSSAPVVEHRQSPDGRRRDRAPSGADGLAAAARREATAQLLLRHADSAMYAAKGAGKSRAVLADVVVNGS